jgi:hypothetical protein
MMYVEAPNKPTRYVQPGIFLAGGISNCPDWQSRMSKMVAKRIKWPAMIFNPRRTFYPKSRDAARKQIRWEFDHLWKAEIVTFWFCRATLCPITLYELGSHLTRVSLMKQTSQKRPRICIGIERGYQRTQDVLIQRDLLAPNVPIVDSIQSLVDFVVREVEACQES